MPTLHSLTSEQQRAAGNSAAHAFIVAAPGAGKTTVAAERYGVARFLENTAGLRTLGVSFARSATQEFRDRVQRRWGATASGWPNEIATLDAVLCELLRHLLVTGAVRWPGGHTELTVLDTWRGQTGSRYLLPDQGWRRVAGLRDGDVVSRASRIVRAGYGIGRKDAFEGHLHAGLCTHDEVRGVLRDVFLSDDLWPLLEEYLRTTTSSLVVDEVFDANNLDVALIILAGRAGLRTTLIGDPWQALYEFRGARPELVPELVDTYGYETFPVTHSFRFTTSEMRSMAESLRAGHGVALRSGATAEVDAVLASEWSLLWEADIRVLPLSFGRIDNLTDAAIILLLDQVVTAHFGRPAIFSQEALSLLGLNPDVVRMNGAVRLRPVLETLSEATVSSAAEAMRQLRSALRDLGSPRQLRALPVDREAAQQARLHALALRLNHGACIPGMTIHQAKGKEWSAVGLRFKPSQIDRVRHGLSESSPEDRALYVALTRARERVRVV